MSDTVERAELSAARINDLPDSAFAYIEPGGTKDEQGKTVPRSLRHFPIHDAAHVRNALARAPQSPFGAKAMPKIRAAAKKFGIGEPAAANRVESFPDSQFMRSYPLEDIRILSRAQGSEYADGRTVEAYAAVFDTPAEIRDHEGHYLEVIDRAAFNRTIEHDRPQGSRTSWNTKVFFNHGLTLHGTPSDKFSGTLGSPVDIRAEQHGLLTVTRYNLNPLADEVLEMIRSGDVTAQSFSGQIKRSDPVRPRRGYQPDARGELATVRRLELGLREYGPTPFPAYVDAGVVGVRTLLAAMPAFMSATRDSSGPDDIDTSSPDEPVTDDPPPTDDVEGHSSRIAQMRRHAIEQTIAKARRTRPGLYMPKENDET